MPAPARQRDPGRAGARLFNFRFSTASTAEGLRSRVHAILDRHRLDYTLEWTLGGEPFLTPRGELIEAVAGAIRDVTGVEAELSTTGGTSDGRFITRICPQVVEFGPVNTSHPQAERAHRACRRGAASADLPARAREAARLKRGQARQATVDRWLREIERRFRSARLAYGHGTHDAREEAAWLVCHVLRIPFDRLGEARDGAVSAAAGRRLAALTDCRIRTREPLAYLLREAWLQHRRFYVDRRVIVPRSHIAELLPDRLSPWLPAARSAAGPRSLHRLGLPRDTRRAGLSAGAGRRVRRLDGSRSRWRAATSRRTGCAPRPPRPVRSVRRARPRAIRLDPLQSALRARRRDAAASTRVSARACVSRLASGRDGLDFVRRLIAHAAGHLARRGLLVVEIGDGRRRWSVSFRGSR